MLLERQLRLLERGADQAFQIVGRAPLQARRNLLGQELEEQLGHESQAACRATRWPRALSQLSQQARASARTRPM